MNEVDTIFKILTRCIDGVMTDDEFHPAQDETEEELQEFLESLNSEQFGNVRSLLRLFHNLKQMLSLSVNIVVLKTIKR